MPAALVPLLVQFVELAFQVVPHVVTLIEKHGELSDAEKAALTARVEAARRSVAEYVPRDV